MNLLPRIDEISVTMPRRLLLSLSVACALALSGALGSAHANDHVPDVEWEALQLGPQPDRALHSMILDSANDMLWAFGGIEADPRTDRFHNTVYRYDLSDPDARWTLVPISGLKPPPLAFHTAIYRPAGQQMVVYGGLIDRRGNSGFNAADRNSIWFLDLNDPDNPSWTRESVPGMLVDRFAHSAVYLPEYDAMVISGGLRTFTTPLNDNHALLFSEEPMRWLRLANAGFFTRAGHALIYQASHSRLLAYGGLLNFDNVNTIRDIDALDLSGGLDGADRWTRLQTASPGRKRAFGAHVYDPDRDLWWVQGGVEANNAFLRELSVLDFSADPDRPTWVRTNTVRNGPLERFFHVAVFDPTRNRGIFQGGTPDNERTFADTRVLNFLGEEPTATATAVEPTDSPTPPAPPTPSATTPVVGTETPTSSPSPSPTLQAGGVTVEIEGFAFNPDPITVTVGTEIRWINRDGAPHTSTSGDPGSPDGIWDSGVLNQGENYSRTFDEVGTFRYYCEIHPGMTGTVYVIDENAPTPTSTLNIPDAPARIYLPQALKNEARDIAPPTPTSAAPSAEIIGQIGGEMHAVALSGNLALVGQGPRVLILDVSNPAQPQELWRSEILRGLVNDIAIEGNLAYIASNDLTILDISNPAAPQTRSVLANAGGNGMAIASGFVYIALGNGMQIYNASNPSSPSQAGFFSSNFSYSVAVAGSRAYLGGFNNRFTIIDVIDPNNPAELGRFEDTQSVRAVAVEDSRAYLGTAGDGLRILDISDPTAPAELGALTTENAYIYGLALSGGRAYLAIENGELIIADVSDGSNPQALGTFAQGGDDAVDVTVDGDRAFMVSAIGGLDIADVSDPAAPSRLGGLISAGRFLDAHLDGVSAFVSTYRGVEVINISNAANPTSLSSIPLERGAVGMDLEGGRLFTVNGFSDDLLIHDISNPNQPQLLGESDAVDNGFAVDIVGDKAYVAQYRTGLWIGDVSDPSTPTELGTVGVDARMRNLTVSGSHAYLAGDTDGLVIIDVSDPAAPSLVTTLDLQADVDDVVVSGDLLISTGRDPQLQIWDISNPNSPNALGSLASNRNGLGVTVVGTTAYIAQSFGLRLVDLSDPNAPAEIANLNLDTGYDSVTYKGGRVYLTGINGLLIAEVNIP